MHFVKNFDITDDNILIGSKSPNAGTSGTTVKNLNPLDNLINYDTFAPGTVSLSSSSQTADIAAGTGAQQVTVYGLSSVTSLPISEVITLNATDGRISVTGTQSFSRVFAAEVTLSGSGQINAGDIYVYTTGTALTSGVPTSLNTTWVKILAGEGSGANGLYTVPSGKKAIISNLILGNRSQIAVISIWARNPTSNTIENVWQMNLPATSPVVETTILKNAYEFVAGSDLYLRIIPTTSLAVGTAYMLLTLKNA
jgi:hypothetical protein